jgi:hypothetical protein
MTWQGHSPANNGGTTGVFAGGWGGGAPPNGTTGIAFNIARPGRYLMTGDCSGWSATVALRTYAYWIDGGVGGVGNAYRSFFFNTAGVHAYLGPVQWVMDLAAGTHYLYIQFTGSSDANDSGVMSWLRI